MVITSVAVDCKVLCIRSIVRVVEMGAITSRIEQVAFQPPDASYARARFGMGLDPHFGLTNLPDGRRVSHLTFDYRRGFDDLTSVDAAAEEDGTSTSSMGAADGAVDGDRRSVRGGVVSDGSRLSAGSRPIVRDVTILFSHGNAEDIAHSYDFFDEMARHLVCRVVAYDYCGYGVSDGSCNEESAIESINAVFESHVLGRLRAPRDTVVLMGRSVGSGPTTDLSSRERGLGGLFLLSPLASASAVAGRVAAFALYPFDIFRNIDKIPKVNDGRPIMFYHGLSDEVINVSHGKRLFSAVTDARWEGLKREARRYGGRRGDDEPFSSSSPISSSLSCCSLPPPSPREVPPLPQPSENNNSGNVGELMSAVVPVDRESMYLDTEGTQIASVDESGVHRGRRVNVFSSWVPRARHNDVHRHMGRAYFGRMDQFLDLVVLRGYAKRCSAANMLISPFPVFGGRGLTGRPGGGTAAAAGGGRFEWPPTNALDAMRHGLVHKAVMLMANAMPSDGIGGLAADVEATA